MAATSPSGEIHDSKLSASVVIPTYNRCGSLERVLQALARQTLAGHKFEVVLVADGCTDGTVAMCYRLQPELPYALRIIEQGNSGPAAARNRAISEARAELIVFVDDDVVPDERLLEVHLAAHMPDASDSVVAIGPLLPPRDTRLNAWGAWEERTLCGHYAAMQADLWRPTYRQLYTGNASVARRHILAAGGFDGTYSRAEDIELGRRLRALGCTFAFLPEARGWHYVQRTFASWANIPVAYGRAIVSMSRAHGIEDLVNAGFEYQFRKPPVRLLTRLCLGSPVRVALATAVLHGLAVAAWAMHVDIVAYASCSLLYNMRLYDGLAAELGGARTFWRLTVAGHIKREDDAARRRLAVTATRILNTAGKRPAPVEVGIPR